MKKCSKKERTLYPTASEIMAEEMDGLEPYIEILKAWKKKFFPMYKDNRDFAYEVFGILGFDLLEWAYGSEEAPMYDLVAGDTYSFNRSTKIITMDEESPSIISFLHEVGHAIYGNSELLACRFSVQLFKAVFPKAFAKLEWDGHMLKRKVC